MKHQIGTLIVTALLGFGPACSPGESDESSLASLDNTTKAAGESYTAHACGVAYEGAALSGAAAQRAQAVDGASSAARNAAVGAVLGAPEKVAKPFFDVGGTIEVGASAAAACRGTKASTSQQDLAGSNAEREAACWRKAPGSQTPVIYVGATDPAEVRYLTLKMLLAVWVELFVEALDQPDAADELRAPALGESMRRFKMARERLATAFLGDVRKIDLNAHARLERLRARDGKAFENGVLIEAAHSDLCNDDTRRDFAKSFAGTLAAYEGKDAHAPARQFRD
jgi:hypothetical protein